MVIQPGSRQVYELVSRVIFFLGSAGYGTLSVAQSRSTGSAVGVVGLVLNVSTQLQVPLNCWSGNDPEGQIGVCGDEVSDGCVDESG